MKLKKWDKVRFVKKWEYWSDKFCSIGQTYQIINTNKWPLNIRIILADWSEVYVNSNYFELVQEEKLPQSQTSKPIRSCEYNWSIYKEDTIDWVSIEDMKATRDNINSKLLTHRNLFNNPKK